MAEQKVLSQQIQIVGGRSNMTIDRKILVTVYGADLFDPPTKQLASNVLDDLRADPQV